ncbi:MAG: putative oxidoreductase [Parcubacteria group bacterium Gr01-1014_19]|nr:MAG: putative oxidoreductase [Parcubacteria group bacterium Gr01-1014_19]
MNLKDEIKSFFSGELADDETTLDIYSRDASLFQVKPSLVASPKTREDIGKLVNFVDRNRKRGLSITARSGGTCMTGGPLSESIIIDVNKHLNRIKAVSDDGYATTEPGAFYRDFEKATLAKGWLMPSYPASREICTVGGMVSNNSGGEKTLSYGKTEDYVEELKIILRDGKEYTVKPLDAKELKKKMAQDTLEGKIYKQIFELVEKNYEALQKAKPKVSKNSSGYFLWNVWDKKTFNLPKLIVGSQGTLGIITEIKFRLIKPKSHSKMLAIFLKDLAPLAKIVNTVLTYKPESFESYDDNTLKLAMRFLPEFVKLLKTNVFKLAWEFLPEFFMTLTGGLPKLVLIAEFTGDSEEEVARKAQNAKTALREFHIPCRITKTAEESKKYWVVRRESFNLLRHHIKGKHTAPFIDDMTVRPEQLPEFLPRLNAIMSEYKLIYTVAGHIGDANFHIIPLMDLADPESRKIIPELSQKVYDLVFEFGGSMSGEHNDGLIRTPFLEKMYGKKIVSLFKKTKQIFDPHNIFNPGKKVDIDVNYSMEHLAKQ